jgi:hypothetical protein
VTQWDYGQQRWDLVALEQIRKIQASLKPGGLVVVEGFASAPDIRAPDSTLGGQLAELFSTRFEVVRNEIVEDVADWGQATHKLVRFVARKR